MTQQTDFPTVFKELKSIIAPFAKRLNVTTDTKENYSVDGPYSEKWKRDLFFASANIKKNYVSFYLMPVYMYPDLLNEISPELKKHMQGKSCFNFKKVEPQLLKELADLTKKGYQRFQKEEGWK
ncbi:MAG TPA: hypothetical protein VK851_01675 [Anaerolineales bacterium]|nr:hypothetical protein [Anaerolineales bacterium]